MLSNVLPLGCAPSPIKYYAFSKRMRGAGQWWHVPALVRQKQADLCELEVSLVYRASCRTGSKVTQKNPVSKKVGRVGERT